MHDLMDVRAVVAAKRKEPDGSAKVPTELPPAKRQRLPAAANQGKQPQKKAEFELTTKAQPLILFKPPDDAPLSSLAHALAAFKAAKAAAEATAAMAAATHKIAAPPAIVSALALEAPPQAVSKAPYQSFTEATPKSVAHAAPAYHVTATAPVAPSTAVTPPSSGTLIASRVETPLASTTSAATKSRVPSRSLAPAPVTFEKAPAVHKVLTPPMPRLVIQATQNVAASGLFKPTAFDNTIQAFNSAVCQSPPSYAYWFINKKGSEMEDADQDCKAKDFDKGVETLKIDQSYETKAFDRCYELNASDKWHGTEKCDEASKTENALNIKSTSGGVPARAAGGESRAACVSRSRYWLATLSGAFTVMVACLLVTQMIELHSHHYSHSQVSPPHWLSGALDEAFDHPLVIEPIKKFFPVALTMEATVEAMHAQLESLTVAELCGERFPVYSRLVTGMDSNDVIRPRTIMFYQSSLADAGATLNETFDWTSSLEWLNEAIQNGSVDSLLLDTSSAHKPWMPKSHPTYDSLVYDNRDVWVGLTPENVIGLTLPEDCIVDIIWNRTASITQSLVPSSVHDGRNRRDWRDPPKYLEPSGISLDWLPLMVMTIIYILCAVYKCVNLCKIWVRALCCPGWLAIIRWIVWWVDFAILLLNIVCRLVLLLAYKIVASLWVILGFRTQCQLRLPTLRWPNWSAFHTFGLRVLWWSSWFLELGLLIIMASLWYGTCFLCWFLLGIQLEPYEGTVVRWLSEPWELRFPTLHWPGGSVIRKLSAHILRWKENCAVWFAEEWKQVILETNASFVEDDNYIIDLDDDWTGWFLDLKDWLLMIRKLVLNITRESVRKATPLLIQILCVTLILLIYLLVLCYLTCWIVKISISVFSIYCQVFH